MRTFDRATFLDARRAWDDGEYGPEWVRLRELAAQRGFIYPPAGTRHDDRENGAPTQRAIVFRALQDNPTELRRIVGRCSSWSQVVDQIIGLEARLAEDADYREKDAAWGRDQQAGHREAASSVASILERLAASRGVEL